MSTRIATATSFESSVSLLQQRNHELTTSQLQMTSGKRISKPSDDPAGAARVERALADQSRAETRLRSIDSSRNAMTLTESALGNAIDLTQTARETLVSAGNAAYSGSERQALAAQLQQVRLQLLSSANQPDGNGSYLFGGQGLKTVPFADALGGVAGQSADQNGWLNAVGDDNLPLSVNGRDVWLSADSGNGTFASAAATANQGKAWINAGSVTDPSRYSGKDYQLSFSVTTDAAGQQTTTYAVAEVSRDASGNITASAAAIDASGNAIAGHPYVSGKAITDVPGISFNISGQPASGDAFDLKQSTPTLSVFDALDRAVAVLSDKNASTSQVSQAVNSGLRDLDQVLGKFQTARTTVGETLNRLDGLQNRTDDRVLSAKTTRANAEDLDMVQAVSDFTNKQTSYQAALQSYAMVQRLSLFQYIGN
ncbi:MAG: hypothetical protein RLY71_3610 [Pseudomonadota bacterium]